MRELVGHLVVIQEQMRAGPSAQQRQLLARREHEIVLELRRRRRSWRDAVRTEAARVHDPDPQEGP